MIYKSVSKILTEENSFSECSRNIISAAKLSKLKRTIKQIKLFCFGNDIFYNENMNSLALIKSKSHQYHSIL